MEQTEEQYVVPVEWKESYVKVLDQTELPERETYLEIRTAEQMWDAIKRLCVRGAPAIGIAAAYGVCAEMRRYENEPSAEYHRVLNDTIDYLATSRPTAVNLFWALDRMRKVGETYADRTNAETWIKLEEEAKAIEKGEEAAGLPQCATAPLLPRFFSARREESVLKSMRMKQDPFFREPG